MPWKCPTCKREFQKTNQTHSCTIYPLKKHFEKKEKITKTLFKKLKKELKTIGPFKIESLPCCIHFVNDFTFAATYALKNKIRVTFAISKEIKHKRIYRTTKMSTNRFLHAVDIEKENQINKQLLSWLKGAYTLKKK